MFSISYARLWPRPEFALKATPPLFGEVVAMSFARDSRSVLVRDVKSQTLAAELLTSSKNWRQIGEGHIYVPLIPRNIRNHRVICAGGLPSIWKFRLRCLPELMAATESDPRFLSRPSHRGPRNWGGKWRDARDTNSPKSSEIALFIRHGSWVSSPKTRRPRSSKSVEVVHRAAKGFEKHSL